MVKVTCEKTGVEFEAATKRTRNHPAIMSVVNEANKNGWYREAIAKLDELYGQYDTVEPYIQALRDVEAQHNQAESVRIHQKNEDEAKAKELRRQRAITNNFLRDHGYHWSDLGFPEDAEIDNSYTGPTPLHDWQLFSEDSRPVSVQQTMQELAATGNAFAKEWLAERNIAEVVPEIVVKRQEAEQAKAEYEQELISHLTKLGIPEEEASERAKTLSGVHLPEEDYIWIASPVQLDDDEVIIPVFQADLMKVGMLLDDTWYGLREMKIIKQFIERMEEKYGA